MTTYAPKKLPDPGAVALLGSMLLLDVRESDGRVVRHEWDNGTGPGLLWSPSARAIFIFTKVAYQDWVDLMPNGGPVLREHCLDMKESEALLKRRGIRMGKEEGRKVRNAAKLFRQWSARPATRLAQRVVPDYPLSLEGGGVKIDYRSDKWNGRNGRRVDYTHAMSSSGADKVSYAGRLSRMQAPTAFFIKGPRLTVTERGIIY